MNCKRIITAHPFHYFYGPNYTGKTHTACHIALQAHNQGRVKSIQFITGSGFISSVLNAIDTDKSEQILFNKLGYCSILILDDYLGSDKEWQDVWCRRFNELLRFRADNNRITIITSNVTPKEMIERKLDAKIASRICGQQSNMAKHCCFRTPEKPFHASDLGDEWTIKENEDYCDLFDAKRFVDFFKNSEDQPSIRGKFNLLLPSVQRLVYHLLEDEYQTNKTQNLKSKLWNYLKSTH